MKQLKAAMLLIANDAPLTTSFILRTFMHSVLQGKI